MRPIGVLAARLSAVAVSLCCAAPALADGPLTRAGEIPRLQAKQQEGLLDLPLKHTDVHADVVGYLAQVSVTQTYGNPFKEPIEAVYVFPLPDNSAVDDFKMVIGQRVIEGEIQKREDARRTYEEARRNGNTAALLEQERPNIFTQSIANIAPGEEIRVVIRYVQDLAYDEGSYEFVFPMVVAPRYMPGAPSGEEQSGTGPYQDTTRVRDASRISPFYVPEGQRSGHDVSLQVEIDAGLPVREWSSPTHEVRAQSLDERHLAVQLSEADGIPNRDFILRWAVAGKQAQATVLTHKGQKGGFFTLVVQPPALDVEALVGERELIFVVDSSGSMSGLPLWLCQEAMRDALKRMRPSDTFNVITFSGATAQAFERPRRATQENIADARTFVDRMSAGGGTEMLNAISAALKPEVEAGRRRYVFFLTDGEVGNDDEIIGATRAYVAALEHKGQSGRVFSFGVGPSMNRSLLEGIARSGKGLAVYASNREDPARGVIRFFRMIDHPVLEDVSIDWGGLSATHVHPSPMSDLFLSRPLIVHGKYELPGTGRVVVRGYADGHKVEIPVQVQFPKELHGSSAIATLWARAEIGDQLADLAFRVMSGANANAAAVKETVIGLGIAHRLITPFTSFVAVDRSRVVGNGAPVTVNQPVEVPEDTDAKMSGAIPWGSGRGNAQSAGLLRTLGVGSANAALGNMGATIGNLAGGSQVGDAGGFGGLGMRGTGAGGGGSTGYGYGVVSKGSEGHMGKTLSLSVPVVNAEQAMVSGSLDGELIRQVIRRNMRQVKYCYESSLQTNPGLAGRIVVRFTIGPDGHILSAEIVEGTLRDLVFEQCLLARLRSWIFPAPKGNGSVIVTYPFTFTAAP